MSEPERKPLGFNLKLGLEPLHEGPLQPERPPEFKLRLDNDKLWLLAGAVAFIVAAAFHISFSNGGAAFGVFVGLFLVGGLILSFVVGWSAYLIELAEYRIRNRGRK